MLINKNTKYSGICVERKWRREGANEKGIENKIETDLMVTSSELSQACI